MRKLWWIGVPAAFALLLSGIIPACSGEVGGTGGLTDGGGNGSSDGVGVGDGSGVGGGDGSPIAPCVNCKNQGVGNGGSPFDPGNNESNAVGTDPGGALVIDQKGSASQYNRFLWVADTNLPGVVKIDLDTLQMVARYRTGGNSTSRTTVNVLAPGARSSRRPTSPARA